jgi:hypothetical protein
MSSCHSMRCIHTYASRGKHLLEKEDLFVGRERVQVAGAQVHQHHRHCPAGVRSRWQVADPPHASAPLPLSPSLNCTHPSPPASPHEFVTDICILPQFKAFCTLRPGNLRIMNHSNSMSGQMLVLLLSSKLTLKPSHAALLAW